MQLASDKVKTLGERIKEERKSRGWSQAVLGDKVDVTQAAISEIERGETKESGKLIAIAKAFNIDVELLTDGLAEVSYRKTDIEDLGYAGKADPVIIPSYNPASVGIPDIELNEVALVESIPFSRLLLEHYELPSSHCLAVLELSTSGMEPTMSDRQLMIVDVSDKEPKSSRVYLLCLDNKLFVKRLIYTPVGWLLKSDNKDKDMYPDFSIDRSGMESLNIQGRIVWRGGTL